MIIRYCRTLLIVSCVMASKGDVNFWLVVTVALTVTVRWPPSVRVYTRRR
jgi:hypothetical protein